MTGAVLGAGWSSADVDRRLRYHSEISYALTLQRTALESALIPVTAYILVAAVEAYRRYPEMVQAIAAAVPPEQLGRAGHRFATQIDNVHLWAVPNFPLVGRKVLGAAGMLDPDDDRRRLATLFDFWERASGAFRFGDGTHQAADAGGLATPYRAHADELAAGCRPVEGDEARAAMARVNALLTSYLFLLWFDTRSGYQDTGPYEPASGGTMLVRSFGRLGVSHFPWSTDVGASMPYDDVVAAFVLDGVSVEINDFGTAVTHPDDYLARVRAFGLFDVSGGTPVAIDEAGATSLALAARAAQRTLYRRIAAMERRAKIDAGAYVYFTFLRPFAELAGVELDWTVPRDSLDLYPLLELVDGSLPQPVDEAPTTYYAPLAEGP